MRIWDRDPRQLKIEIKCVRFFNERSDEDLIVYGNEVFSRVELFMMWSEKHDS